MGAVGACERNHLGIRWGSLRCHDTCGGMPKCARWAHANAATGAFGVGFLCGHETREGCAEMCAVGARERSRWGLRLGPLVVPRHV
eukprot:3477712-Pyramimonas_sp.AAC.1